MFRAVSCGLLTLISSGIAASAETDIECVARTSDHMYCFHWRKHGLQQAPSLPAPPPALAPVVPQPGFPRPESRRKKRSKCEFGRLDRDCWGETLQERRSRR